MEGWVHLGHPVMHWPGVELAISRSQVRRPNHYTTEPPSAREQHCEYCWCVIALYCHFSGFMWLQLRPVLVPLQRVVTLTSCQQMPTLSDGNHIVIWTMSLMSCNFEIGLRHAVWINVSLRVSFHLKTNNDHDLLKSTASVAANIFTFRGKSKSPGFCHNLMKY